LTRCDRVKAAKGLKRCEKGALHEALYSMEIIDDEIHRENRISHQIGSKYLRLIRSKTLLYSINTEVNSEHVHFS
jgi:hypothetical protein